MKLLTIKDKETGTVQRVNLNILPFPVPAARHLGNYCKVPKKLYKRQLRDQNRIRSKRKPNPFGSKLLERLGKTSNNIVQSQKKKAKPVKLSLWQRFKEFIFRLLKTVSNDTRSNTKAD